MNNKNMKVKLNPAALEPDWGGTLFRVRFSKTR